MKRLVLAFIFIVALASQALAIDITLSWVDNATNEDGFKIYRSLNGAPETPLSTIVGANVVTFVDKTPVQNLNVNNVYCYRVTAYNSVAESSFSNPACKTIIRAVPDGAPSNLTVQ